MPNLQARNDARHNINEAVGSLDNASYRLQRTEHNPNDYGAALQELNRAITSIRKAQQSLGGTP
jgi:hypothetical protein